MLADTSDRPQQQGGGVADGEQVHRGRPAASPSGQRLEWLGGFYYTRETGDLGSNVIGQGAPFGAGTLIEIVHLTSAYEEEAGFATVTYHFTPQFDVARRRPVRAQRPDVDAPSKPSRCSAYRA